MEITSDKFIIDIVLHGLSIELEGNEVPDTGPHNYKRPAEEIRSLGFEIEKLKKKGVIVPSTHQTGEVFSTIFARAKNDGSKRMILNLKRLNSFCTTSHFKMESIHNVINMVKPGVWMASVDLKDAFYSVPIHCDHQ